MRARPFFVAVVACLLAGVGARAAGSAAEPGVKTAAKPKPARPKIAISKETTYITGPLRPDGYPDYLAALNELMSRGVTPENNAAVPFWRAVGPKPIPAELRPQFFKLLGIEELPEQGAYLVSTDEYWLLADAEDNTAAHQRLWDQVDSGQEKPWSAEDCPELAAWLTVNQLPLDVLVKGTPWLRFYSPSYFGEDEALPSWAYTAQFSHFRELARLLTARAMLRVKSGKTEEAWQDLLACYSLGRSLRQSEMPYYPLIGIPLEDLPWKATSALAHCGSLTAGRAAKCRGDLANLPALRNVADTWCVADRYFTLNQICDMAARGSQALPPKPNAESTRIERLQYAALQRLVVHVRVDWDEVLRLQNDRCDRVADALRKADYAQRFAALDTLLAESREKENETLDPQRLMDSLAKDVSPGAVAQHLTTALGADIAHLPKGLMVRSERSRMQSLLSQAAFALAGYRAEHGRYPANLAEPKPKYIAEIPKDLFTDKELVYRPQDGGKGYVLYSLGPNGRDDGGLNANDDESGKCDNVEPDKLPDDIAIRTPAAGKAKR